MALSESGLAAQGITPGPMIYGPGGSQKVIRPKSGSATAPRAVRPGGKQSFYAKPKGGRKR